MSDIPKVLYHYCSLESFRQIMTNKSIWLSDISMSNDREELLWARNYIAKYLKDDVIIPKDESSPPMECSDDSIGAWAFCLSKCRDSLSQWRGYADNGRGVCIGFKTDMLKKLVNELYAAYTNIQYEDDNGNRPDIIFGLSKIHYSTDALDEIFKNYTESGNDVGLINTIAEAFGFYDMRSIHEYQLQNDNDGLKWITQSIQHLFKNRSFEEEKEWRYYFVGNKTFFTELSLGFLSSFFQFPKDNYSRYIASQNYDYISRNDMLISHIEQKFNNFEELIEEIIIGPKCKVSCKEMSLFLSSKLTFGKFLPVDKSKSSYR